MGHRRCRRRHKAPPYGMSGMPHLLLTHTYGGFQVLLAEQAPPYGMFWLPLLIHIANVSAHLQLFYYLCRDFIITCHHVCTFTASILFTRSKQCPGVHKSSGAGSRSAQHNVRIWPDVVAPWQKSRLVRVKNEQEGGRPGEEEICLLIDCYQQR